ncbi:MAG: 50S ribosomal protein L10 [Candidatus Acidiferrales bacterium]
MAKKRAQKEKDVETLHTDLLGISSLVLSTFQGLSVARDTELRRAVQAAGGKYRVVKNTLAQRAAEETPVAKLLAGLKGVNSIAYTKGDPIALAKVLTRYAKDNPAFTFRAGVVEGRVLSVEEFKAMAALPTREELLSKLLGMLNAPAQRLVGVLSAPARQLAVVLAQAEQEKKFSEAS